MTGESRWSTYDPFPASSAAGRRHLLARPVVWWGVLALVVVVTVGGLALTNRDGGDAPAAAGAPDALSSEGLGDLRDDIEERTGGTEVFRAVIFQGYAFVDLPLEAEGQRMERMRWDGELDLLGPSTEAAYERVDLTDVEASLVEETIQEAKDLVEDPISWHVVVQGTTIAFDGDADGDGDGDDREPAGLTAHAVNESGESAAVKVALDGTPVRTSRNAAG